MGRPHLRLYPNRGSHLPVLMKIVNMTQGPILELGCGLYSTNPLHWACHSTKRRLVTYENNPDYFGFIKAYENDFHEVHCINDWSSIDISEPWSVAFVDHEPASRRAVEIKRLSHAEYVVAHDANNKDDRKYRYSTILKLYKYHLRYAGANPHTTIFSNKHDVRSIVI